MLCEYQLYDPNEQVKNSSVILRLISSNNNTGNAETHKFYSYFHWTEYLLCFWVFSMFFHEIYQVKEFIHLFFLLSHI